MDANVEDASGWDSYLTGLRFAEQVTGMRISAEPPTPDSPLGRILAFVDAHGGEALTPEHIAAAQTGRPLPPA